MHTKNPHPASEATVRRAHAWSSPAFWATAIVVMIGTLLLCSKSDPFLGGLFFVPFAFGPLAGTIGLAFACRSTLAQYLLTVSSVSYGAWFAFIYVLAFGSPDPQSPIAFLFVGIYAVPVLAIYWIAAATAPWRK
jgi:hypothetical protein